MKKYILIIGIIALTIIFALFFSVSQIQKENTKTFSEAGYILQSKSSGQVQDVERYYFNANENYKKQYNEKIMFKDTSNDEVVVMKDNFLHYTNGSISSLTKGVILNLDTIENDPIVYYTISENQILKKNGDNYTIKNLNKDLTFKNFVLKISDTKYLVCGSQITINFNNGQTKDVLGYIEIEYSDNEVVKIYNQEVTYQTVSSNLYLSLENNVKINLGNKIVSKDNDNKMSLENMMINSNDNVEIIDIQDEKYKNKDENTVEENTVSETNTSTENNTGENQNNINNSNSTTNTGRDQTNTESQLNSNESYQDENGQIQLDNNSAQAAISVNENDTTNESEESNESDGEETIVEERPEIITPTFRVEEFDVDSISMAAKITITDENSTLVDNPVVMILRNDIGKIVYENEESSGAFSININVSSLSPDIEYTLVVKATYKVEETEYNKNFIYKIFRTKSAGIELEKDYFTNNTLAFKCKIEEDSKVSGADVVIMNDLNETIETKTIDREQLNNIEFTGLNSNTNYTVSITNILYDEQVITNGFEMNSTYKTLKERAEISGSVFEIDKRNGTFLISVQNVDDVDEGIIGCQYEIYDARKSLEESEPVLIITSNKNEQVTIPVDEVKIQRKVPYVFKLAVTFNDNEKEIELESEYSDIMMLTGKQFPTLRYVEKNVTFERFEGTIFVEDENGAIDLSTDNQFTIIYTDSIGNSFSDTSAGSLQIPVKAEGLRANETYKISVYTKVDLDEFDNDPPIDNCYLGGIVVKTKIPQDMQSYFLENEEDVRHTFLVDFQLQNAPGTEGTLEAETLTGITFNIYAGQSAEGTPYRTIKDVDLDSSPYVSTLKEKYYDQPIQITPEFFGADNKDFRDKYYTITVTGAYDYTTYPNKLPIINNTFTIGTKGYRPDLPVNVENAIDVSVIRNRDKGERTDLDASTIVGYELKAKYNNSDLYARKIVYKVFDAKTNNLIKSSELQIERDGVIPTVQFDVEDGTDYDIVDEDTIRRGNTYYFTYEMYLDLNDDGIGETLYPYEEENVILKSSQVMPKKQEAKIQMYPSKSTNNTITYKYKISDIDHALSDNQIVANIGSVTKDRKTIIPSEIDTDDYQEVTFENITAGNFSINIAETVDKKVSPEIKKISEFYFEGEVNLNNLRYNARVESNRVVITLHNDVGKVDRISAVDVVFNGDNNTVTRTFLYPENNSIIVNLSDIAELKQQQVTVELYAYYDTGLIGYDEMESTYFIYEKAHLSNEDVYYCTINNNKWSYSLTAAENMYTAVRNDNQLIITNPMKNNKTATINLIQLEGGFSYEYDLINQKQVARTKVTSDGNDSVSFNYVIPEISLLDENGKINIQSELNEAKLKGTIINKANTQIKNNLIYIDIYQTDENGNNEEYVRTETRMLNEFTDYITLNNLEPKKYYYIRFKANLITETEEVEEYLYDLDYKVLGKYYYFSTLTTIGINNINVVYSSSNYQEKSIDVTYNLDRIFGYEKIVYTIQKLNEATNTYETVIDNIQDTLFKREMLKQFDCRPGSEFEFNKKYKIIITPIATIQNEDGTTKELDVGTTEKEFELAALNTPLYGITGKRDSNNNIIFRVTVYDIDNVIKDDEYMIRIYNERNEDITPESYIEKKYKTSSLNNRIILADTIKNQGYKIEVISNVDINNDGININEVRKNYTVKAINDSGITVGNIIAVANSEQDNKIDLIFTDSYNLTQIDFIRYSIYDTNGFSINQTQAFVPRVTNIEDETVYTYTINEGLQEEARYFIELQFMKNDQVVDNYSLEYTYLH